jgi:hypothetical protein
MKHVYRAKSGIIVATCTVERPSPMENPFLHLPLSYIMWGRKIIDAYRKPR